VRPDEEEDAADEAEPDADEDPGAKALPLLLAVSSSQK
jgi:hypothetical protein